MQPRGPQPQLSLDVKGNTSVNAETMHVAPPAAATDQARPPAVWVVRANGGQYTDLFLVGGYVAVGWFDLSSIRSLDDIRRLYGQSYPDAPAGQAANETGQIAAFCLHVREGDYVITPSADREWLRYGRVTGPCLDAETEDGCPYRNRRTVDWVESALGRSDLAESLRRTLGSPRTVFRVDQSDEFLTAIGRPHDGRQEGRTGVGHGDRARSASLRNDLATELEPDTTPERPLPETQIGQVWDIADEITQEKGRRAERSEVIERFVAKGGNRNTAGTTYYRWKQHYDALSSPDLETAPENHDRTSASTLVPSGDPAETERDHSDDDGPERLPERPLPETQIGRVWDIADEITREKGRRAERSEVIERFVARGGNRNTAGTTYYRWKQHYEALSPPAVETTPQNYDRISPSVATPPDSTAETRRDDSDDDRPTMTEEDHSDSDSGVEKEEEDPQEHAEHPFDPSKIKIRTVQVLVDQLVSRIKHEEIDLAPDFQRMRGIWDNQRKSRLIESLLLRIPIPVFYVAANEEEQWSVVDGLQRMSTIHEYVTGAFALQRLEYRKELNGQRHDLLPRPMRRRIGETQLVVNVIEPGTPPEVMFNIFSRINTGGMKLNGQEMRNALHPGPVREYLAQLAASEEFATATDRSIKPHRMVDRECVLRFLAFHVAPWEEYAGGSLDGHLAEVMKKINAMTPVQRDALADDFRKAMRAARRIFGRQAFRKLRTGRVNRISKPLFEAWGVQLARCSSDQIDRLVEQREEVLNRFATLLNQDPEFDKAISLSTSMPQRIRKRFAAIRDLVQELL